MRRALLISATLAWTACTEKPATPVDVKAAPVLAVAATCAEAQGEVKVRRVAQPYWEPVAVGAIFRAGDWVKTGAGAYARLALVAGGGIELSENSVVVLEVGAAANDAGAGPALVLAVKEGEVRGKLESDPKSVHAPLVLQTQDGSRVSLSARPGEQGATYRLVGTDGGVQIAVTSGEATVSAHGVERSLQAGQVTDVQNGEAGAATELIDFPASAQPGIDARFLFKKGAPIELSWKPVSGAKGYRVQLARDLGFKAITVSADVAETRYTFLPSANGQYAWHVASQDAKGQFGEYGFGRRIFCEIQQPADLLLTPPDGAAMVIREKSTKVLFSWQSAAEAKGYRLVVAKDAELRDLVFNLPTPEQRLEVPNVALGNYFWGAYVQGTEEPIFLTPRRLEVRKATRTKLETPKAINQWGK